MPRYIEAVKSAEIISEKLNIPLGDLIDVFAEIPTADVAEVKHGHWIYEEDVIGDTDTGQYRCSNCRAGDIHLKKIDVPFCWKCGAKMKEGD